jgi:diadenylate cyclase
MSHLLLAINFSNISLVDVIDVLLFSLLLYVVYNLMKGTAAMRIFIGIIAVYLVWKIVRIFHMSLLTEILGQFISVGFVALIVVFQPEIRQFLLLLGKARIIRKQPRRFLFWKLKLDEGTSLYIDKIVKACQKMADTKTGALIVITRQSELQNYVDTGQILDARISEILLETIFFRNSPLHDGAVIITGQNIRAARCLLPVSGSHDIPVQFGLRHRAAVGITERSDALAIIVSEERGQISFSEEGKLYANITPSELSNLLEISLKS